MWQFSWMQFACCSLTIKLSKQLRFFVGLAVSPSPLNGVNWDWNIERVEISKMSACRFVKSKNQKELHGIPWRCWNWDFNRHDIRTAKGNDDPKLYCFFFLRSVLLLLKMSSADHDAPCAKSMHRLQCNIYVFPVITEEH